MKNKAIKILSILLIIVLMIFAILWLFHGGPNKSQVIIEENIQNSKSSLKDNKDSYLNSSKLNTTSDKTNLNGNLNENTPDYSTYSYNKDQPVSIISIADANMPLKDKEEMVKKFSNLYKHGSLSGGEITHEFKYTEKYKEELAKAGGYAEIEKQLTFKPTDLKKYIDSSLNLVGALSSGTYTEDKGFNSVFRSYDNGNGKKLEINEMYLNPENQMIVEVYKESINYHVGDLPATIEKLKDDNGNSIINLSWNTNNRNYSLTSSNMSENELNSLAKNIVKANKS